MIRAAAALALALAAAPAACGDTGKRVAGPSGDEIRALVADGSAALGVETSRSALRFQRSGRTLRVWLAAREVGRGVGRMLAWLDGTRAQIERFCPKPALLRCRPAFVAWAVPNSSASVRRAANALRRLAARTYDARPLLRRHGSTTQVVTANGELLAAVGSAGREMTLSFGGLAAPDRPAHPPVGRVEVQAGAEALAAIRPSLSPTAQRALAGVRRLVVSVVMSR